MAADSGVYKAAVSILKRAVELDNGKRFTEAIICYQEGAQLLMEAIKAQGIRFDCGFPRHSILLSVAGQNDTRSVELKKRLENYIERAEAIKKHVDKEKQAQKYHEKIDIEDNSSGYSYETVFGRFLDSQLTTVDVMDPYIRSFHQV